MTIVDKSNSHVNIKRLEMVLRRPNQLKHVHMQKHLCNSILICSKPNTKMSVTKNNNDDLI